MAAGDKAVLKEFCSKKAAETMEEVEQEVWAFLGVLFADDARKQLLSHLEFEVRQPRPAAPHWERPPGNPQRCSTPVCTGWRPGPARRPPALRCHNQDSKT